MISELEFLISQVKTNENKVKEKKKNLILRNKLCILFIIPFCYMWLILVIGNYSLFHESFFGNIITVVFIGIHIYVYVVFTNAFLKDAQNKYENAINALDNAKAELDKYLEENNYKRDNFYKNQL